MQIAHVWLSVAPATNEGSTKPIWAARRTGRFLLWFVGYLPRPGPTGVYALQQPAMLVMASSKAFLWWWPPGSESAYRALRAPFKGVGNPV